MANEEQLKILSSGVKAWNKWRQEQRKIKPFLFMGNFDKSFRTYPPDLSRISLRGVDLTGIDFSEVNLFNADLSGVNLKGANLRSAKLLQINLSKSNLVGANLCRADLSSANIKAAKLVSASLIQADCTESNFFQADLSKADLIRADFSRAILDQAILDQAGFGKAHLTDTRLRGASLKEAYLIRVNATGADFSRANLTGSCIQEWSINSATNLKNVVCEHVYLKKNSQERRPHGGSFQPGEFTQRFQKFLETVDLFFIDGIDWRAFLTSFQDLQSQYSDDELTVQGIERKSGGGFEVRLSVSPEANKAAIEKDAYKKYEVNLQRLEAQYQAELTAQDSDIQRYQQQNQNLDALLSANRQHNADLMETIKLLASRPITIEATAVTENKASKYNLSNAQFAGGFAETVQGNQIGGNINNAAAETLSLAEVAAEIQNLLKPLKASNPSPTQAQQMAYLDAMISPTQRERFIGALRAAGGAVIEEVPYGAVLKALVKGWQRPNG